MGFFNRLFGNNLFQAIEDGDLSAIARIIENGADLSARDGSGKTVLHKACCARYVRLLHDPKQEIIKYLVWQFNKKGLSIDSEDKSGYSPLGLLIDPFRDVSAVIFLLDNGADVNLINKNGESHLEECFSDAGIALVETRDRCRQIAAELIERGATITKRAIARAEEVGKEYGDHRFTELLAKNKTDRS